VEEMRFSLEEVVLSLEFLPIPFHLLGLYISSSNLEVPQGKTEIYAKNDYSPEASTYFLEGTPVFLKENWTEANKFIFPEAKTISTH